ncbi:PAS domain-containing protein [Methylobacterium planeticum]|uniref:PAS domain-containing protein n=1 Tax=Methylobacterium planeticum TaxID=2615211 RepID=A0A6N6MPE8_9HYPH|nr:PAS domain-containing protein [Methylobacterium planeticum]KAB1073225.1 PAS domain-containing protein [Methylobacterium planeticum]
MPLAQPTPTLLSALEASGSLGTWETDLASGTVYPSRRFAEFLGLNAHRAAGGVPLGAVLNSVHEADRERVGALVHEAHRTAGRFEAEFRTLGRGGATHWVAARGQIGPDARGRGLRCRGIVVDLTGTRQPASGHADAQTRVLNQLAETVMAARRMADTLDVSVLHTLLDLLLFEVGRELTKAVRATEGGLH